MHSENRQLYDAKDKAVSALFLWRIPQVLCDHFILCSFINWDQRMAFPTEIIPGSGRRKDSTAFALTTMY